MNQQIGLNLLGRAEGEFYVCAMHGITRLEGNHAAPSQAGELSPQFRRCEAQRAEIIMRRRLQTLHPPANVPRVRLVHGVVGAGMSLADAVEYRFGFGGAIGLPDFLY